MYTVDEKQIDLVDYDWKYLAILDSARYDYFMEIYKEFFVKETPKLAITSTLSTPDFLKNFENKNCSDIIYLNTVVKFDEWLPKHNMYKVIHVWDIDWNKQLGTTSSESVNKRFFEQYQNHSDKRFVLHYMQPHTPFVSIGGEPTETKEQHVSNVSKRELSDTIKKYIEQHLSQTQSWSIKKWFHIQPKIVMERYYIEHGTEGIIEAYKNEIRLGLTCILDAMKQTKGKWVITADHGVTVGERGMFGLCHIDTKEIREVPWLEVTV